MTAGTNILRSTFADNQRVTVADAVRNCAAYRNHQYPISIATGYFNLGGFAAIADTLEAAPAVRILIGAEPEIEAIPDVLEVEREDPKRAVARVEKAINDGRNDVSFDAATDQKITRLKDFLKRPTTEVRIYRKRFLHGKAFLFGDQEAVIAGSANFTAAGLNFNLELDLGQYEPDRVSRVHEWYEALWADAEAFDLGSIFEARLEQYDPHTIYLRMLYAQYQAELVADPETLATFGTLQLALFQKIGSQRAIRILDRWNGAILADGVGLGKTVIAGDVIRTFTIERGLRVLIVCPAALRDMWNRFLAQNNLPGAVVSYAQLGRDRRLVDDGEGSHLDLSPDQYRLVVADEAHALRSSDTRAYEAMKSFLVQSPTAKILMLTATPVNNSLWDLYNEVMLFAKTDNRFESIGVPNLRDKIKTATQLDPDDIDPSHLFSILDAISVRRTRRFIKEHFQGATIGDKIVAFPEVTAVAETYDLNAVIPDLFDDVADAIENRLSMARYQTQQYAYAPTEARLREEAMAGLLRSQMLKRFESSAYAFRQTLAKMIASHEAAFDLIENKNLVPLRAIDASELLDDESLEDLLEEGEVTAAEAFDVTRLCTDLRADTDILRELEAKILKLNSKDDPKLQKLLDILRTDSQDPNLDKRKTLVFTSYVATVEYIRDYLKQEAGADPGLQPLIDRSAYVLGNEGTDVDARAELAAGFAPKSMRPDEDAEDKYDLLVTTDVLAEGQNLQQCGRIVNFDLPWNPMRIVQRNGRIDRIGSPHDQIYAHCFMPDVQLDSILRLEERLQLKIAHANAGIGVESVILPGSATREQVFTDAEDIATEKSEQIRRLAEGDAGVFEELDRDDAYSGEQFREELRSALLGEAGGELENLPWGIGSGHNQARGPAIVFLARAGRRNFFRLVDLSDPTVAISQELLESLKRARCSADAAREYPDALRTAAYEAWERVRTSIHAQMQAQRDPATRQDALPKPQREAIDLLSRANSDAAVVALEALTSRWPKDVESDLRRILREENRTEPQRVAALIEYVQKRGLRPEEPEEVPDIRTRDIKLICYQVIVPKDGLGAVS
jgi:superfamily II DNA/RNA helicase